MSSDNYFDFNCYLGYVVYPKQKYVAVDDFNDLIEELKDNIDDKPLSYFENSFDDKLRSEINKVSCFVSKHLNQASTNLNYVLDGWKALSDFDKKNVYKEKTVKRTLRAIYLHMNKLKAFYKLNCFLVVKVAKKFHVLLSEFDSANRVPLSPGPYSSIDTYPSWQGTKSYRDFESIMCSYEPKIKELQKKCVSFSSALGSETYPYLAAGNLKYGHNHEVDSATNKVLLGMKIGLFVGIIFVIVCQTTITRSNRFALWKSYGLFIFSVVGGVMVFNITWAMNIRIWTRRKINYLSIFQIPHLEPNTMKVLQDSGTIMCVFAMCLFWFFETGRDGGKVTNHAESVACPLFLLLFVVLRLIYNVVHGRMNHFGQGDSLTVFNGAVLYRCLIAPFTVVTFRDIYAADVLTSFNKVINDGIYGGCWIFTGAFLKTENDLIDHDDEVMCSPTNMANVATVVIAFVLWIRMAQCGRRYYDTKAIPNLFNIVKYGLAFAVAVVGQFVDVLNPYYMTLVIVATLYKWYWDIAMDWGLLDPAHYTEKPYFLRPKRFFKDYIYYVVSVIDLVLRFLWIVSLMPADDQEQFFGNYLSIQLGYLEILRRAMWGVFRVEWEHIVHEKKSEFGFFAQNDQDKTAPLLSSADFDEDRTNVVEYKKQLDDIGDSYVDRETEFIVDDD